MSIRKGDNVIAGASVGFIGKPAWVNIENVSNAQLLAGYAAPKDGIIILSGNAPDNTTGTYITIQGHNVNFVRASGADIRGGSIQCPVSKGDIVKCTVSMSLQVGIFVPFEYSGVSDINVITPEYIRNLHDPDWNNSENMVFSSNKWTATKRGIVAIFLSKAGGGTGGFVVNNVRITDRYDSENLYNSGTVPVSPGDVVTITGNATIESAKFVPYKAQ